MRLMPPILACFLALANPAFAEPDSIAVALRYVQAQEAVMAPDAGPQEVDALLAFYANDYVYYHPQVGAKVSGLDTMRRGISSHLGETSNAKIEVQGVQISGDHISMSTVTRFTMTASGETVVRSGVMVLTIRNGRIVQRIDI